MFAFKFIIPGHMRIFDSASDITWTGKVAVTIANDENQAKQSLSKYAENEHLDSRWLEVANISKIYLCDCEIVQAKVISWAEV